jgi:hypothetical protein
VANQQGEGTARSFPAPDNQPAPVSDRAAQGDNLPTGADDSVFLAGEGTESLRVWSAALLLCPPVVKADDDADAPIDHHPGSNQYLWALPRATAAHDGERSFMEARRVSNPRATRHRGERPAGFGSNGGGGRSVTAPRLVGLNSMVTGGRTMGSTGDSADRLFAIVSRPDGKLMNLCPGPAPDGRCASAERGEVPCAGARVVPLRGTAADGLPFSVAVAQQGPRCPLEWVDQ